jgi:hypothetical protein
MSPVSARSVVQCPPSRLRWPRASGVGSRINERNKEMAWVALAAPGSVSRGASADAAPADAG